MKQTPGNELRRCTDHWLSAERALERREIESSFNLLIDHFHGQLHFLLEKFLDDIHVSSGCEIKGI